MFIVEVSLHGQTCLSSGQPVRADVSLGRDVCRQLIILTSNNSPQSKVTTLIYAPLHTSCHRVNQTIEMHVLIKIGYELTAIPSD